MIDNSVSKRIFYSLGIHSAAIIAFQLVLMQLLSVVQWHHFAFMVISIAMLGFGASGTFIALFRKRLIKNFSWIYPLLMVCSGLFMLISFPLSRIGLFEFDVFRLFSDYNQIWVLAANYLIFFIPFFLGATSIGLLFIKMPEKIGKCYFFNLFGSGLGGILILFLTGWFLPEKAIIITAILSIAAGLLSFHPGKKRILILLSGISLIIAIYFLIFPFSLNPSEYKSISKTLNLPDAEIEYRKPDTHGIIEIVSSPALRYAPSLSMNYTGKVPIKKSVFVNGNFYGVIPHDWQGKNHIHSYTTMALPYIMQKRDKALILNAGTGSSIAHALSQSVSKIDASIENYGIIELMQGPYVENSGNLFNNNKLNINHANARIFLSGLEKNSYDLIKMPVMEAFGGTSGLNSLHENYDLTLEAFDLMWKVLKPEGVISITSWMDYPARTSLKIAATLVETARNNGIDSVGNHIAAIRSWGNITYVIKKNPINDGELNNIRNFCNKMFFDPAYLRGIDTIERDYFNKLEDSSFFTYLDEIIENPNPSIYQDYGFAIKPSTDDKPHFSQFLRIDKIKHVVSVYGLKQLPFLELGYLTVILTLVQSTVLAIILIILPLFRLRNAGKKKVNIFLFFASLGLGYMFLEIILIQKFVLYFGYPIYAITAVISTMLIASGAGSLYSAKIKMPGRAASITALIIMIVLFVYTMILPQILENTLNYSVSLKIILALMLISIPAFFMGMPFPMAIRHMSHNNNALIPWAWGINGCFSVISSALAMLLALEIGFKSVLTGAFIFYFLAFLALSGNLRKTG
ncbi:MAG: hypothetical protein ACOCWC_01255 [Bacteroidota bacterium]